jgi:cobalt-zinc-cadmium resistance protein CzcA
MAYTLSFALLGAILLTLMLVPALLSYALNRNALAEKHSRWIEKMQNGYRGLLARAEARRWPVVAA